MKISFLDVKLNRYNITIEFKDYLSFTGECGSGLGQVLDHIVPANKYQKCLMSLWEVYHLQKINILGNLNYLKEKIEEFEDDPLDVENPGIKIYIEENFDDLNKIEAIITHFELNLKGLETIKEEGNHYIIEGMSYIIGTDEECNEEWEKELEHCFEELVLPVLPETLHNYIDYKKWESDAKIDGRSHILNRYDGREDYITHNNITYYIYRK